MAYEVVMPYHLHMPSYFLETFTEYPFLGTNNTDKHGFFIFSVNRVLFMPKNKYKRIIFQTPVSLMSPSGYPTYTRYQPSYNVRQ